VLTIRRWQRRTRLDAIHIDSEETFAVREARMAALAKSI
jgi:hypothetical protein